MVARGNWFKPCTRETNSLSGSFNSAGTTESTSKSSYQQGCQLPIAACAPSLVEESRSPLFLLKPEILLMSFRGISTAGALDLLSVWGVPTLSPETATQKKTHRREKAIHCKPVSDDCPFGEGRNPGQGKAGGGRRMAGGEKLETNSKPPRHKEELKAPQQLMALGCCLLTKSEMKSNSFCPKNNSGSS